MAESGSWPRWHTGMVQLDVSTSIAGDQPPLAYHAWGTATLDDNDDHPCSGNFAWASFTTPQETGGSLHPRCTDGTLLGARLEVVDVEVPENATWSTSLRLMDGFLLPA